jgi:hypothetical protein
MSSKRRIRKNSCTGKVVYETKEAAITANICYYKKKLHDYCLHEYKCKFCKKWHLGHNYNLRERIKKYIGE